MAYSSQGSTRLLQLTGKWQYDGIIWLALRSVKSNNVEFLNQIRYSSIKQLSNCPYEAGWTSFQNWPTFKIMEVLFFSSSSCTIICCINRFTSLCKNLFNLLEFSAEASVPPVDRQALKMMHVASKSFCWKLK